MMRNLVADDDNKFKKKKLTYTCRREKKETK